MFKRIFSIISTICLAAAFVAVIAAPFLYKPAGALSRDSQFDKLPERRLVVISPHWDGVRLEFERAFVGWAARKYGYRAKIDWLNLGGTSDAMRYVQSEFKRSPAGINVDVFFGGGLDPFIQMKKDGMLQKVVMPPEYLKDIPDKFSGVEIYDHEGYWYGACLSGFGIIYNKPVLKMLGKPEPATWDDLGKHVYYQWVGSGDPRSSGSVHMVYEIILQSMGWERGWAAIVRMCGNMRGFSRSGGDVPKDTAYGELACGLAIDVYALKQIAAAGQDNLGFVLPANLTVINPDGIGILKGALNRETAQAFLEFVMSEEGQRLWLARKGSPGGPVAYDLSRMPVNRRVYETIGTNSTVDLNPYNWKSGFVYDSRKGSARWDILNDLLGACIIDVHGELKQAWGAIGATETRRDAGDPVYDAFVKPPMTERELMNIAEEKWSDPVFRGKMKSQWARDAKAKYLLTAEIRK